MEKTKTGKRMIKDLQEYANKIVEVWYNPYKIKDN